MLWCREPMKKLFFSLGFTYVELLLSIGIILSVMTVVFYIVRPEELKSRARDEKRFSDLVVLENAVNDLVKKSINNKGLHI
jgi:type II secretory pathway pseudopilin PulG